MKMAIFKNVSNHKVIVARQIVSCPQETFSAPVDNNDVQFLVSRGLLEHMDKFDTVGTKEARPEVLNKDTWDMI